MTSIRSRLPVGVRVARLRADNLRKRVHPSAVRSAHAAATMPRSGFSMAALGSPLVLIAAGAGVAGYLWFKKSKKGRRRRRR